MTQSEEIAALRHELTDLKAQLEAVSARVRRTNDYMVINNLQRGYGYYVDKGQWNQAADLFAEDGTLEIAGRGVYIGRERVREYLNNFPKYERGKLFNHMQLQPVITIADDGLSAKGRWRAFIQIATLGKEARWGEATYENAYVKRNGVWQIAKLLAFITFYSDYDTGWDKGGIPLLRSFAGLEPDAPPTYDYEAWPEVFTPPYHYRNPVTGQ